LTCFERRALRSTLYFTTLDLPKQSELQDEVSLRRITVYRVQTTRGVSIDSGRSKRKAKSASVWKVDEILSLMCESAAREWRGGEETKADGPPLRAHATCPTGRESHVVSCSFLTLSLCASHSAGWPLCQYLCHWRRLSVPRAFCTARSRLNCLLHQHPKHWRLEACFLQQQRLQALDALDSPLRRQMRLQQQRQQPPRHADGRRRIQLLQR
jgi:hypothetical protein